MSLGYDVSESNRSFEKEGISGEVRRYSKERMSYPNFTLVNSIETPVEMHKLQVLSSMFNVSTQLSNNSADSITIYYREAERIIKLGKIAPRQVKAFLRLFDGNQIVGMLNSKTELKGSYLYVLSN